MAVITYDVSGKQIEVKAAMKARGYGDAWVSNGTTCYLPNTTLWKQDADVGVALQDIQNVAITQGVRLLRALAVPHTPWAAIQGEPHTY